MVTSLSRFARPFPLEHFFQSCLSDELPAANAWRAPLAIWEDEDVFHVEAEMPGVADEDIDVTVEKNVLTIKAERKLSDEDREYMYLERRFGEVERTITLPDTVDATNVEAELSRGVLHMKLAKKPESQPKKIEVKTK